MNNRILVATVAVIFSMLFHQNPLMAQSKEAPQTLFEKNPSIAKEDIGFILVPTIGFTQMDGSNAAIFNLRGGISYQENFSFGAYFNTSINQIRPQSETLTNVYMDYWTVGGFGEYTWKPSKLVHLTFPLFVGFGEVQMDNEAGDAGLGEANFFQIEPTALLELNLHKHVRFNLGAGYRIVSNMEYRNFNQSDISGLIGQIGLKFIF
ncbi:hypothetical protein [Mongoliitalea daihaiensis]|uniref:hypothetical protein n=1 Tax=Mongoliitalea daihaiensis TaxID=2782006 RepID=UPI001F1F19B7|nr:hypothetical protein [Mongoliitalea daihaiensis]UJP66576.1 hypothetical protein IPZ59_08280 [Mongoliitalea daihaiensis]